MLKQLKRSVVGTQKAFGFFGKVVVLAIFLSGTFNIITVGALHPDTALRASGDASTPKIVTHTNLAKLQPIAVSSSTLQAARVDTNVYAEPAWLQFALFRDPLNEAASYYAAHTQDADSGLIKRMAEVPVAMWFGDWQADVARAATNYTSAAAANGSVPVLVLYNIPYRDCGNYSAGGVASENAYISWVQQVANGIANRQAVVIVEPDGLSGLDCLPVAGQQSRLSAMARAVTILKANPNTTVYLDAGNPAWQTSDTMITRLTQANIAAADGFSLNVSSYFSTARNQEYGDTIAARTGKHYVIDVSRNGNSAIAASEWCNNITAAFGQLPTTHTGHALNDALLWVKISWESDGTCNGGPTAGIQYWPLAIALAKNAGW